MHCLIIFSSPSEESYGWGLEWKDTLKALESSEPKFRHFQTPTSKPSHTHKHATAQITREETLYRLQNNLANFQARSTDIFYVLKHLDGK
ncbi:hypothetical protein HYALB_00007581 [Hymenoscyphus albidus]|uniref:Uncharacterized protein n=1 Tax=Hymenoscyphus albidus TaxID=595503 RepID=A0A9N9LIR4_9HELO|nr:hypothetical protein HYALB_00007581 [Hymenoscyphus albidus]